MKTTTAGHVTTLSNSIICVCLVIGTRIPNTMRTTTMRRITAGHVTLLSIATQSSFVFCFTVIVSPLAKPHRVRGESQFPLVYCKEDELLACFRLASLLFLTKALAEAVGLSNKFKNVPLAREPV